MALETGVTYIEDLVDTNPVGAADYIDEGDDHIRNIKTAVQGSFPSLGAAAVTKTAAEINDLVEKTDPVLNGTLSGTAFLDDDALTADSAIAAASQQSIKAYVDALGAKTGDLNTKILEIGDWNMDASTSPASAIPHGVTMSKIRTLSVTIRNDANTEHFNLDYYFAAGTTSQGVSADGTNIKILRAISGIFDNANFDSTGYNRGWVTIQYTD